MLCHAELWLSLPDAICWLCCAVIGAFILRCLAAGASAVRLGAARGSSRLLGPPDGPGGC